jgi:hypothetical protein
VFRAEPARNADGAQTARTPRARGAGIWAAKPTTSAATDAVGRSVVQGDLDTFAGRPREPRTDSMTISGIAGIAGAS